MTKIIGLTGGIGSGKTTLVKHVQSLGIPVYIADDEAKIIMELPEIKSRIFSSFGIDVFENDKINRKKLAKVVFQSPEKRNQLNAILHPEIKLGFENWLIENKKYPYIFKEAAILFESGSYKDCDKVITVIAPLESRIQRVINRDNNTRKDVLNRIAAQWTDEMKIQKSDFVINNISIDDAIFQLDEILKKLDIH